MSTETSETGDSEEQSDEMPVQNLRNRLDTVVSGDELTVEYRSERSGSAISVSGEVTDREAHAGSVWWVEIDTEDGRTVRVEDSGDVETVREDGGRPTLGPVLDFQRAGVNEPELMADGGRVAAKQGEWEQKMIMNALHHHADRNPGAVVEVGSDRMVDLSGEPGHIQRIVTDGGTDAYGNYRKRIRVMYIAYGGASDVTARLSGERIPAGDLTPEDIHASAVKTHVEFIGRGSGPGLDNVTELVEGYISERWDPDWNERERVSGQVGDGDE